MKRYNVNGTEKKDDGSYCQACRNGAIFKPEYLTDYTNSDTSEHICAVCNSKYMIPKIKLGFNMETGKTKKVFVSDIDFGEEVELTKDNTIKEMIKIALDFNIQRSNITMEEPEHKLMNTYDVTTHSATAKANANHTHIWLESKPFKTAEGTHTIKNCAICKLGELNYKGVKYQDDMMRLVTFVADMGILHAKTKVAEPIFPVLDEVQSDTGSEPLFEIKQEEPIFEIEVPIF